MPGPIGVFDSGFGGLDVLRGIVSQLPQYDYIYLGDTARAPYGSRSGEVIYLFTCQAVDFLYSHGCRLIVIACNTASAEALRRIQQEYVPERYPDLKVLGVLIPLAEAAIEESRSKRIGVIGTEMTVGSNAFVRELTKIDESVLVSQHACPLLVPIVEAGEQDSPEAWGILENYVRPLLEQDIDTLILGCTHYGVMEEQIRQIVGGNVSLVRASRVLPERLAQYLARHSEVASQISQGGEIRFFSTDPTEKFQRLGSQFFGQTITVAKANLI